MGIRVFSTLLLLSVCFMVPAYGQNALSVFLDCDRCDEDYFRREIDYVDYVRDRTLSELHILVSLRRTGSGREYTINFIGREQYSALTDTLLYSSSNTDTDDERRRGLVKTIEHGLVRYLARSPGAQYLSIVYEPPSAGIGTEPVVDKWDFWVFEIGTNGFYSGEQSTSAFRLGGDVSASRVTDEWKLRLRAFGRYRESNFDVDDSTITSILRNGELGALAIKSVASHWSVGAFSELRTSSFNNTTIGFNISPAIEYSYFPYGESSSRELRFSYFLDLRANRYDEVTIFEKTSEFIMRHEFQIELELEQPWGEAEASLEVSNYITDFTESKLDLYNIELGGYIEFRVARGLSVYTSGSISRVNDQISLPLAEASEEEILLGNVRLPTSFQYGFSLGISYTFGSIFNNIVNPRFGS
ncbi:MAG: hypothetical protein HKN43_08060 [Rhodothermales bacterium]|nr:hypothetical protein [Rhodothermales bacterium]